MNPAIILFLTGLLYVSALFFWRFRLMKGKHPNTDLIMLAWKGHPQKKMGRSNKNDCSELIIHPETTE